MAGTIKQLSAFIAVACIVGCALSAYSYYLAITLEEDDEYEALCDISEHISCTKVLQSEYVLHRPFKAHNITYEKKKFLRAY